MKTGKQIGKPFLLLLMVMLSAALFGGFASVSLAAMVESDADPLQPIVVYASRSDVSPPLRSTALDIPLTPVATRVVSGFVTDGAVGWPLYAHLTVRGDPIDPVAPYDNLWSDPITGYYSVTLTEGITYTFDVQAWVSGYLSASREIGPLAGNHVEDWTLDAEPVACDGPGYLPNYVYDEDFEAHDGGYTHSGPNDEWEWDTPSMWPFGCASGDHCWGTDIDGDYEADANQSLYSPLIDLSAVPTNVPIIVQWQQAWLISDYSDTAFVEISINGGPWTQVWMHTHEEDLSLSDIWIGKSHDISAAAGGNVQFRWRLVSNEHGNFEGLYVDDVAIQVGCALVDGGLVVGQVYDANTGGAVPSAIVAAAGGDTTIALSTPDDPGVEDGLYVLFSPPGSHTVSATMALYEPDEANVTVLQDGIVQQDFYLSAGRLVADPTGYDVSVQMGARVTVPLTLNNDGAVDVAFELAERNKGYTPDASANSALPGPALPILEGGAGPVKGWEPGDTAPGNFSDVASNILAAAPWGTGAYIPTGSQYAGAGVTVDGKTFYLIGGRDHIYSYDDPIDIPDLDQNLRYDPATDNWDQSLAPMPTARMNVSAFYNSDDGMIYVPGGFHGGYETYSRNELEAYDPASDSWVSLSPLPLPKSGANGGIVNGRLYLFGGDPLPNNETQIYDIASDTWFGGAPIPVVHKYGADVTYKGYIYVIGGWNETTFYRYDPATNTWEAGPSLNTARQSPAAVVSKDGIIYAWGGMDEWNPLRDGEYYDLADWPGASWSPIGGGNMPHSSTRAAHVCADDLLWLEGGAGNIFISSVNQNWNGVGKCYHPGMDVPWLSTDPVTGSVGPSSNQVIDVIFDTGVAEITQPGLYHAQIEVENDTPYGVLTIPVTMTVLPPSGWGKVEGVVTSLGYCDDDPFALKGVSVLITDSFGVGQMVMTGNDGAYAFWKEEIYSPLLLTISHPDYETVVFTNVVVTDQATVRRDVDWRWPYPCVSVDPVNMSATLDADNAVTKKLTISNDGAVVTYFELREPGELFWLVESPTAGTVEADDSSELDVTITASPIMPHGVYAAVLDVRTGDVVNPSIHVPVTLTVAGPWEKRVYVNDVLDIGHPVRIASGDVVRIVDRIEITHTDQVTFTLVEDWTEPLVLVDYAVAASPPDGTAILPGQVITSDSAITWTVAGLPGDWSYVITKTFDVGDGRWYYGYGTDKLWLGEGTAVPPFSERVVRFIGTSFDTYLPFVTRGL